MFSFIKQVFTVLLSFSEYLARVAKVSEQTKFLSLNDDPSMIKPTPINLNPAELKYYSFMVSLDKDKGSCNSGNDLSMRICIASKI